MPTFGSGYLENYAAARKFLAEHKPPTRPARQEGSPHDAQRLRHRH
jgi:hypothetical protein